MTARDYIPDAWHLISFHTDLAELEVGHFASAAQMAFEVSGMPDGCEARRHVNENGTQLVFLSPAASALVHQMPKYRALLESCYSPSNFSDHKKMGIFE